MSENQKAQEYAIIIGSYTNACSIIHGLKKIKYPGSIIAIDPRVDKAKCMAEVLFPDIKVLKRKVTELDEIVEMINEQVDKKAPKTIFMTTEEFIEPIRKAMLNRKLINTSAYTGSAIDNDYIFDRLKFYRFVEGLGITNIPRTISSDNDPYVAFGNSFIIRVNKSWDGNRKLPPLKIVHSKEEKECEERHLIEAGLTRDMWSYQELLSTADNHNVSVCGWYDEYYHQFAVTRKILQHPPKIGNGDVIEIYHDAPKSLVKQTESILKALKYTGAFEMEFVLDTDSNEYKLIELNPRFWMQHGLIEKLTDNSLIRRALGQENIKEIEVSEIKHMYWVNGMQALYRLAKGQIRVLGYLKDGVCAPPIGKAIRWTAFYRKYVRECK